MGPTCTCPSCGIEHEYNKLPREVLSTEQRLRLFRLTFNAYKSIRDVLVDAAENQPSDSYSQLIIRQLQIAILRKYILDSRDNVHLWRVLQACQELLPEEYSSNQISQTVLSNIEHLKEDNLSTGLTYFVGDERDDRGLNQVVIDNLYGLLLHGDYKKAMAATEGSPLNNLISTSEWFGKANLFVTEVSMLVERALGFIDKGSDLLVGLPPFTLSAFVSLPIESNGK